MLAAHDYSDDRAGRGASGCRCRRSRAQIHVTPGKFGRYYHVRLELRPWDFALSVPLSERRPRYAESNRFRFSSTGQFEIFVRTRVLPVAAPHCRRYVMARMPATDPADPAAGAKLQAKRALFDRLQALKSSGSGSAAVVVELNPYVRVASETPLRLELTQCNVFFRQVNGAYVDRVEP